MPINILGTEYTIERVDEIIMDGESVAGMLDSREKKMQIKMALDKEDRAETITHEVVHGYLIESGLPSYFYDEVLVDWIACMLSKISATVDDALKKGGCY